MQVERWSLRTGQMISRGEQRERDTHHEADRVTIAVDYGREHCQRIHRLTKFLDLDATLANGSSAHQAFLQATDIIAAVALRKWRLNGPDSGLMTLI